MSEEQKQDTQTEEKTEKKSEIRQVGPSVEQNDLPDSPKTGKPVDVNGDITPITRKEVPQVDSTQWSGLHPSQLQEQLNILEKRMAFAQQIGHEEMIKQIRRGINELRLWIKQKTTDEIKLI